MSERPERVALSLGANLGNRARTLDLAVQRIAEHPDIVLIAASHHYATDPVGVTDQPEFLNMAVVVETTLDPERLLATLHEIERDLGRRERLRWHEREIDIDIVLFADRVVDVPGLRIPHEQMHLRRFVLEPLTEIAPEMSHPTLNATVAELLSRCDDTAAGRRIDR